MCVLPIYKRESVVKLTRYVMDMECECFCESEAALLECGGSGGEDRI